MAGLKTMHDIRSLRSVATRKAPTSEGAVYLQLHRLASEKLRLEREAELWLRKKERIEARMAEIAQQMESLRRSHPEVAIEKRVNQPQQSLRPMSLEY